MTYNTILDELCQNQKAHVQEILKCISQYIRLYSSSKGVQCVYKKKICDSVVLGIVVQKLKEHQLPMDPDIPVYCSMDQIRAILAEIEPHRYIFLDMGSPGCCSNPLSCSCGYCKRCRSGSCWSCGRRFAKPSRVNHADCFKRMGLQKEVLSIIQKVEGLGLARFSSKTSKDRPAAVWDSLNYV